MMSWKKSAPLQSPIWITEGERPPEHLYLLRGEPERPESLSTTVCWTSSKYPDVPKEPSQNLYLGSLEWLWSPMHSRIDSYYLSYTDEFWLIYLHELEDGGTPWSWDWRLYAFAPKFECQDDLRVGYWMIHDVLLAESCLSDLDRFHIIGDEGLLKVSHFTSMSRRIWDE